MSLATPTLHPTLAALGGLGPSELIIILLVLLLLFGGRKLPEMARGTGRALRIFKAETKGLMDDDDDESVSQAQTPTRASLPPAPSSTAGSSSPHPSGATAASELDASASGYSTDLPPTHTES